MIVKEGYQLLYNMLIKKYISGVSDIEDYEGTINFFIGDGSAGDATENDVYMPSESLLDEPLTNDDISISNHTIIIRKTIDDTKLQSDYMSTSFTIGSAGVFVELNGSNGAKLLKLFSRITFDPITLLVGSVIDIEYVIKF